MALRRTTVFAKEDDLAVIKAAAARHGVAEAEIIRDAIHLAALAHRVWDEPFFSHSYEARESVSPDLALDAVWAEKATAYEQTKTHPS